ncbi:MAG: cytochrome c oxidase subunit II [Candidatus Eisenbacteria bacterium]|uniref:Cytochrome c oxidase subunit 2 n=1 Tax=Eiseniibacteriota bacterium TaxID=2212470 RepID=A0A956SDW3_UNCEI|nr:cytochrome c oxidase subunit II [Candidatus Eisenbacteria bacterium]MCB9464920.1 cytochrome c oxidase subunit II [Candidatus Eisenbacteria bacterium]
MGVAQTANKTFYMPPQASASAAHVDWLFDLILWISVFFFVLIVILMVMFIVKYRVKDPNAEGPRIYHNTPLEITWTAIPLAIVVVIFWLGFKGYMDLAVPPANAYEIQVTGQKWKWLFTYPNGYVDEILHVPSDRPVTLVMTSTDVIHAMYIPAFRAKTDVMPGRYTKIWFDATEPGTYPLFCAEYCGTGHSAMITEVLVHGPGEFETWMDEAANWIATMAPEEAGLKLYSMLGCQQCHSTTGAAGIGPTWAGLFGSERKMKDGSTIVADENYIRQSILEPQAEIVAGFDPVMPTFQGRIKDDGIAALIAYMKSLQ